jgi:hypothetical protein
MSILDIVTESIAESVCDGKIIHLHPTQGEHQEMAHILLDKCIKMDTDDGVQKYGGQFWQVWLHFPS